MRISKKILFLLSLAALSLSSCNGSGSSDSSGASSEESTSSYNPEDDGPYTGQNPYVKKVANMPDDFIIGMDSSSVLSLEESGVKYYDFNETEPKDLFVILKNHGINTIRIRIWVDPWTAPDGEGVKHGYGGGNVDIDRAVTIGKRVTAAGMKVLANFHYSDFWADPKRQHAPKAWEGMGVAEKSSALYDFTKDSIIQLLDAGVDVGMVQIGNEINYGMSGETKLENVISLLKAGSMAIRDVSSDYGKDISIVVHYTRITDKGDVLNLVSKLVENDLDFDMIGMSYYPFWDGGMDNMSRVLELIQERYGKKAFLAETSYAYTTKDGDGSGNSFKAGDEVDGYEASVEGQASIIHEICEQVSNVGGIGVFYWEGAWIPVGPASADNSPIWEEYGSGWASSYASDYDPEDAALYYGGCSWDNQAFFDFTGHPLESINVFKYMRFGE